MLSSQDLRSDRVDLIGLCGGLHVGDESSGARGGGAQMQLMERGELTLHDYISADQRQSGIAGAGFDSSSVPGFNRYFSPSQRYSVTGCSCLIPRDGLDPEFIQCPAPKSY